MGKSLDVLVFGSATIDYITHVERLPKPGEAVSASFMETCFGGKGANQSVAAARLGASTALVAKVGDDLSGDDYLTHLQRQQVDVSYVEKVKGSVTGMTEIALTEDDEYYRINVAGANTYLTTKDVCRHKKVFRNARVLLCQLEVEMKVTAGALRGYKGVSILHCSPMRQNIPDELISLPSILVMNQEVAAKLTEMEEVKTLQQARKAAKTMVDGGAKSVIILMDDHGAVHLAKGKKEMCTHVPAADVKHLADPSGADDAFLGGLAYHMARFPKLTREHHISAANACAAYSMGFRGVQPSFPGRDRAQNNLCEITPFFTVIKAPLVGCECGCEKPLPEEMAVAPLPPTVPEALPKEPEVPEAPEVPEVRTSEVEPQKIVA